MLGIIGAMDEEVAKVKEQMEDVSRSSHRCLYEITKVF